MKVKKTEAFLTCVFDENEKKNAQLYWTPEKIAEAVPIFQQLPNEIDLESSNTVQPATNADVSVYPFNCGGKLLFTYHGKSYYGSAQVVGDNQIMLSAAHCVRSNEDGEWACNLVFYRAYTPNGPAQIMPIHSVSVRANWAPPVDFAYDYAFLTSKESSGAGFLNYELLLSTTVATAIGYPKSIAGGNTMQKVTSNVYYVAGWDGIVAMVESPFTGGSSGGAWLKDDNKVVGLNSFGTSSNPDTMFGPLFNDKFEELFNYVKSIK